MDAVRRGLVLALLALFALAPVASAPAAAARRSVPWGFLGTMLDGPLLDSSRPLDPEFDQMVVTGVESVRFAIYWNDEQPYATMADVPPAISARFRLVDGIPTDFSASDRLFAAAAARGLRVLPVVIGAPPWARRFPARYFSPPADPSAYGRFCGELAARYGPHGSFWAEHPGLAQMPVHAWQIWNEPAGGYLPDGPSIYWDDPGEPFQQRYIAMLRAARAAIHKWDPAGQVVLAALFGAPWHALASIYARGARGLFDVVAVNEFTLNTHDLYLGLRLTRQVMFRNGDGRLPLIATEVSWPSALGHVHSSDLYGYEQTQAGQAAKLQAALRLLAEQRQRLLLQGVYWDSWLSADTGSSDPFAYAGLRFIDGSGQARAKPAQLAYRLIARRLEGCAKSRVANRCA